MLWMGIGFRLGIRLGLWGGLGGFGGLGCLILLCK